MHKNHFGSSSAASRDCGGGSGLPLIALLGGSFNPPHIGHFRIALEAWEALRPERLLLIPSALPPHKAADGLLPFALRVRMLQAVLRGLPGVSGMEVCTMENERPGPSYTVDTLIALAERHPGYRPAFIMGGEDLPLLPSWDRWERLTELADLVILPRGRADGELIAETIQAQWPGACAAAASSGTCATARPPGGEKPEGFADACGARAAGHSSHPRGAAGARPGNSPGGSHAGTGGTTDAGRGRNTGGVLPFSLPGGGRILFLDRPRLDVSSSILRQRWLRGDRLDFLLPKAVLELLEENREVVSNLWRKG